MRTIFVLLLAILSSSVVAKSVTSFGGYAWGTSGKSIMAVRGAPSYLNDTRMEYRGVSEEVHGYPVRIISYAFKAGCSKSKETTSQPCDLWGGYYIFATRSEKDFAGFAQTLSGIYGDYSTEVKKNNITDHETKKIVGVQTKTALIFEQEDGSKILLTKSEYDRDFYHKIDKMHYEKGIYFMLVRYFSAEYNTAQKKKQALKKKK